MSIFSLGHRRVICKQTFLEVCCPAQLLRRLKSYDNIQQCPQQPEVTVMEEGKFGKYVLQKKVVQMVNRIQVINSHIPLWWQYSRAHRYAAASDICCFS